MSHYLNVIDKIREIYGRPEGFIPLHEPCFSGNEKKYLNECIDSTFVSSVGQFVNDLETNICEYTGAGYAVAVVNGTAALHLSLEVAGVQPGDLVITQALSFVATANAVLYAGAEPYFIDVDRESLGMSDTALSRFLDNVECINGQAIHRPSRKRVAAIVPMHTFGNPAKIDKLIELCDPYGIPLIEDAAESLGSFYKGKHTGTFGLMGVFSFNGNKIVTSGGGGMIITNDEQTAKLAKHLSTQAKVNHPWEFRHDQMGYNYRCPNLNAALALAQLEQIESFVSNKEETYRNYKTFFSGLGITLIHPPQDSRPNYWLNAILLSSKAERNAFLKETNENGVMTRPAWTLLNELSYLSQYGHDSLQNSIFIDEHLVNIPSSVRL